MKASASSARRCEPVAIGRLERFVGDFGRRRLVPRRSTPPALGKVAIVGSGPAGLACAGDWPRPASR